MAYVISDIRLEVMHKLVELQRDLQGGREAYLSGLWSGLVVQGNLMSIYKSKTYNNEILAFVKENHSLALPEIIKKYNDQPQGAKLNTTWFVGEAQRQSRFGEQYYEGLSLGMQYVAQLFWAFYDEEHEKAVICERASRYLAQVIEWVREELYLRSHIHEN